MRIYQLNDTDWLLPESVEDDPFGEQEHDERQLERTFIELRHQRKTINKGVVRLLLAMNAALTASGNRALHSYELRREPPDEVSKYTIKIPRQEPGPSIPKKLMKLVPTTDFRECFSDKWIKPFPTVIPRAARLIKAIEDYNEITDLEKKVVSKLNKIDKQHIQTQLTTPTKDVQLPSPLPTLFANKYLNPYLMTPPNKVTFITDRYAGPASGYEFTGKQKRLAAELRTILQSVGEDFEIAYAATVTQKTQYNTSPQTKSLVVTAAGGRVVWISSGFPQGWSNIWHSNVNSLWITDLPRRVWKISSPLQQPLINLIKSKFGKSQ